MKKKKKLQLIIIIIFFMLIISGVCIYTVYANTTGHVLAKTGYFVICIENDDTNNGEAKDYKIYINDIGLPSTYAYNSLEFAGTGSYDTTYYPTLSIQTEGCISSVTPNAIHSYISGEISLFNVWFTVDQKPGYHLTSTGSSWYKYNNPFTGGDDFNNVGGASITNASNGRINLSFNGVGLRAVVSGETAIISAVDNHVKVSYRWVANSYTVNYDGNGATEGSVNSQNCTYDTVFSTCNNNFIRTGYTFTGWNTKADGTGTSYGTNQSVTNLSADVDGTVTLYAQWSGSDQFVKYNSNDGTEIQTACSYYNLSGSDNKIAYNVWARTGYLFINWNTEADGTGTNYNENDSMPMTSGSTLISSAVNQSYMVDVAGGSSADSTNVQLYQANYSEAQYFSFVYRGNYDGVPYWSIQNTRSGKALDVAGGAAYNGANVQMYTYAGGNNQLWQIIQSEEGYWVIKSKLGDYYLDLSGCGDYNQNNIQIWSWTGGAGQQWTLDGITLNVYAQWLDASVPNVSIAGPDTSLTGTDWINTDFTSIATATDSQTGIIDTTILESSEYVVADGEYVIAAHDNRNYALNVVCGYTDNGTNVELYQYLGSEQEKWEISYVGDGFYKVINVNSGKALNNTAESSNVQQWEFSDDDDQCLWYIVLNSDGTYSFCSKADGHYLEITDNNVNNATNIQVSEGNSSDAQKFRLIPVSEYYSDGESSMKSSLKLSEEGIHTVLASAINGDGLAAYTTATVKIDKTAPTIHNIEESYYTQNEDVTIEPYGTDALSGMKSFCLYNSAGVLLASSTDSFEYTFSGETDDVFTLVATDVAGNVSDSTTFSVTIETKKKCTVNHYVMNTNGTYDTEPTESETVDLLINQSVTLSDLVDDSLLVDNGITYDHACVNGKVLETYTPQESCEIDLYYVREQHTVTYDVATNGGAWGNGSTANRTVTLRYGAQVDLTSYYGVKEYYSFTGWNANKNSNVSLASLSMGADDITLYAIYAAKSATLTINHYVMDTDGSYPTKATSTVNKTVVQGVSVSASMLIDSSLLVSNGIQYDCAKVGNVTVDSIVPAGNTTINIYYKRVKHTVSYDVSTNGGTWGSSSANQNIQLYYGASIPLDEYTGVKSGWTFLGWNTDSSSHSGLSSLQMGTSDVTLYALYSKEYTATFIDASGSTVRSVVSYNNTSYGEVISPVISSLSGYETVGWNTVSDISKSGACDCELSGNAIVKLTQSSVTYYAVYKKVMSLSYELNGGEESEDTETINRYSYVNAYDLNTPYGETIVLPGCLRSDYDDGYGLIHTYALKAWAENSETGTNYTQGQGYMLTADTTMYALWTEDMEGIQYNIVYVANGVNVSNVPEMVTVQYGDEIFLSSLIPERLGMDFVCWNTAADGSENQYEPGGSVMNLSTGNGASVLLYAQWTSLKVSVVKATSSLYHASLIKRWTGDDAWYQDMGQFTEQDYLDLEENQCVQVWHIDQYGNIIRTY